MGLSVVSVSKYGRGVADDILGPLMAEDEVLGMLGNALQVDGTGVWPSPEGPWLWLPAMETGLDGIDLRATPGLPIPFDPRDLAAFMVGGVGIWIREFYGPIDSGPDADRLALMHPHANIAREALSAAYAALRGVADSAGVEPDTNTPEWIEWRRSMVCELRQGSPSASAPAVAGLVVSGEPVAPAAKADETPEMRRERIRDRSNYWKGQCVHNFTARVAEEEGLSVERIRQILRGGKTKPTGDAKKARPRKKATFCSGLIPTPRRAR